jgi:hypothetical protein
MPVLSAVAVQKLRERSRQRANRLAMGSREIQGVVNSPGCYEFGVPLFDDGLPSSEPFAR